ncbi:hypothetical protein PC123_g22105 [Phytophthora cactorum]|nr:hypothetical protein PC123_g22105 [Phytophthora cactorum]
MENKHIGILDTWLRSVRDVHRKHKEELDALPTEEARYRPGIHGLVYDVKTGGLKELKVDYCGYYAKLVGEDSLHVFPDGEPTMGLAHRRRNAILDLADGLEKEPGIVRIRYLARMLKREAGLFSPEEVDEAIETIKGQMEDPNNSFMNIKHIIACAANMYPDRDSGSCCL